MTFNWADNERLKESGFALEGKIVNGVKTADGIIINVDSAKALNTVAGHEITHVLEGTEFYDDFRRLMVQFAKARGEYDSRMADLKQLYKDGTDLEAELVADIVGDYIFTDEAFVRLLQTGKRGLFQTVYDEIKYLRRMATAGSKEAKTLIKAEKLFEKIYRQSGRASTEPQYSISSAYHTIIGTADLPNDHAREMRSSQQMDADYKKQITEADIATLRSIDRKSVNDFTHEDIQKAQKWAYLYRELKVKSPFFRAWFGDWRAFEGKKVSIARIPQYIDSNEERKKNRGAVENEDTSWTISISREGETNTISHAGKERLSEYGLSGIKELITHAKLLDTEVHEHHNNNAKNDLIAFDHKLYALGENEKGEVALYRITVEDYFQSKKQPSNKRFHNLKHIEKIADITGGRTSGKNRSGGSTNGKSAITYTVADLVKFVNMYDSEYTSPKQSSVVVKNGEPLVVYHGTNAKFNTFHSKSGEYWFSESYDYAEAMMEERGGGEIKEVYLIMRNPYRAKLPPGKFSDPGYEAKILRDAKEANHDGVIIENDTTNPIEAETFYVVFSPEQIKSATDNIGTFDKTEPNTIYSLSREGARYVPGRGFSIPGEAVKLRREAETADAAHDDLDTVSPEGTPVAEDTAQSAPDQPTQPQDQPDEQPSQDLQPQEPLNEQPTEQSDEQPTEQTDEHPTENDKGSVIKRRALELYEESKNMQKGVKISNDLSYLEFISQLPLSDFQKDVLYRSVVGSKQTNEYGYTRYFGTETVNGRQRRTTYYYDGRNGILYDDGHKRMDYSQMKDLELAPKPSMSDYDRYSGYDEFKFAQNDPYRYEFLQANGVSWQEYTEQKGVYDWAWNNPKQEAMSKVIAGDIPAYKSIHDDLASLHSTRDADGKVTVERKDKVKAYIADIDLPKIQKKILYKLEYPYYDEDNWEIAEYIVALPGASTQEKKDILTTLGFKVDSKGKITWD